ncbi:hypothetical protein DFH06DRAFT_1150599 [Mycena polygramma]|nr:hypothetical protein DFH06DRAFT_1150599 [Mycena polygramma]
MHFISAAVAAALVSVAVASVVPAVLHARAIVYPPTEGDCIASAKYIGFNDHTTVYSQACAAIVRRRLFEGEQHEHLESRRVYCGCNMPRPNEDSNLWQQIACSFMIRVMDHDFS